mmetsp:Transcript_49393/g.127335  ORF Transcript_49393/g.127335 Transcript_49393/m.127335 type:complete len:92 (-) Transcript_49393:40-315(-)
MSASKSTMLGRASSRPSRHVWTSKKTVGRWVGEGQTIVSFPYMTKSLYYTHEERKFAETVPRTKTKKSRGEDFNKGKSIMQPLITLPFPLI